MAHCLLKLWLLLLAATSLQARLIRPPDVDVDLASSQLETKGFAGIETHADDNSERNYRLPNNTIPITYDVELWTWVDTGNRTFNGSVKIELNVLEATDTITLHARQIGNFSATIERKDNRPSDVLPAKVTPGTREFLHITSEGVTFPQHSRWLLSINYTGELRTDNGGFYLSQYTDDAGQVHYLATTQFESTNARHAFPCYDEPNKRAFFTITIHHTPAYTVISNMPVATVGTSAGITRFEETPKMSSYLIAFIVSDFEYTTGELNGVRQRVFSRKGKQEQQEWTLLAGLVVESSLAKYFGVKYALPKLDQAGIPDFSAGAMENWGLATYREQYMWWTKEQSTISLKTNIANIIGHEYAHMWFGNLVSLKWWTYLWLKEGFATLFSYESDDIAFPEWNVYQIYHVSDYNSALINDARAQAVPMTHYVQTPSEISGRYNTYSYAKPSCVLYMFKNAWTDAVFRLGLNKYLNEFKYNSTDEYDLFGSLEQAVDELKWQLPATVKDIFSSWSHQAGYPLLTVERDYEAGTFSIKQQRFVDNKTLTNHNTWYVPINYATASEPDYRDTSATHYLLNVKEYTVSNAKISKDDWLLLNKQSTGYYRILYDEQNYRLIARGLREQTYNIHPRNRAQLLHDAYRFVDTARISQSTLFELLAYLKHEDQYAAWSTANSIFNIYDQYLRGDEKYAEFREFVIELIEHIFLKIGVNEFSGEHYLNKYLRTVLLSLACQVGSEQCHKQAHRKLQEFLEHGIAIEPTVRTQTYCAGLRKPEDKTYDAVLEQLFKSTTASDRSMYISSLGCSQTATQLKKFVEASIDKTNSLSYAERTSLLNAAYSRSEQGLTTSLEFLEVNGPAYAELSTGTAKPLDAALKGMANYVVSQKQKTRLDALVAMVKESADVKDDLSDVVAANMQSNFNWLDVHREPVVNWLVAYRGNGSVALSASLFTMLSALCVLLLNKLN
ncbi:CG31343 [Drosophila busckii]|uniref:Aminopeptidase n=1 Tax=Drosophila busckii TaxID=30019 RepID=A0A0M4ESK0_DROBS|nr:aminopeptidase N [Drosophila busckii]ALC45617.1 CG31343 [Drosophila busckii]